MNSKDLRPVEAGEAVRAEAVLRLLEAIERDGQRSQRSLASELGIALGLVNVYLKNSIKKGLIKAHQAPARRYVYYLTPSGFSEKARLTIQYLTTSFQFFRQAKDDCSRALKKAREQGFERLVLTGHSDLTEVMVICAFDMGFKITAIVASSFGTDTFCGAPVVPSLDALTRPFDGVLITDLDGSQKVYDAAVAKFGSTRVLAPDLLRVRADGGGG